MADSKTFYVLYGSQTGNSECIAQKFHEMCQANSIPAVCMNLNSAKGANLASSALAVAVVCSTTGNGDSPENAEAWWRSVKLRSLPKNTFQDMPFIVLGLGDTNYDKFCHMGKSIDKRFGELGGRRLAPITCADEVAGLEEYVDSWTSLALNHFQDIHNKYIQQAKEMSDSICESEKVAIKSSDVEDDANMLTEAFDQLAVAAAKKSAIPSGVQHISQIALKHMTVEAWNEMQASTEMPVARASKVVSVSTASAATSIFRVEETASVGKPPNSRSSCSSSSSSAWTATSPFLSKIVSAKWLTAAENVVEESPHSMNPITSVARSAAIDEWGTKRRVLSLAFDLAGSGISYCPGDSIGICTPNNYRIVEELFDRLKVSYEEQHPTADLRAQFQLTSVIDPALFAGSKYMDCDKGISLDEFLRYRCDLTSLPKKSVVTKLISSFADPNEAKLIAILIGKSEFSKKLWKLFVEDQHLSIGEFILLFPSCKPTLATLIELLVPMPPRYYSIASSPLQFVDQCSIAFSVVRYTCSSDADDRSCCIYRSGLCTTYLEELVTDMIANSSVSSRPTVRLFHKATINFHLPGNICHPLILIGPGTGVAPFIGFLQHRLHSRNHRDRRQDSGEDDMVCGTWRGGFELENKDLPAECNQVGEYMRQQCAGPIYLFFGCRDERDYLFKDELKQFQDNSFCSSSAATETAVLTRLEVAMSRTQPHKVYVTHKLRELGSLVAKLIVHETAHIYICGDGNHMAKDVAIAIKDVLMQHEALTSQQADELIADMKQRRRYVLDIWA